MCNYNARVESSVYGIGHWCCCRATTMNVLHGPKLHRPLPKTGLGVELFENLGKLAQEQSNRIALIEAITKESINYKDFFWKTVQLAQALKNAGYKENDVLSVYSENNLDFFIPVISCLYLGIVVSPINFSYIEGELKHVFKISRPKIVFASPLVLQKVLNVVADCPWIEKVILINCKVSPSKSILTLDQFIEKFNGAQCRQFKPQLLDSENHLSCILYSSGTTGLPKGVMLSHENVLVRIIHATDPRYYEISKFNHKLGLLPFFHGYGFVMTLGNLNEGDTVVVIKKFQEELFLKCIEEYKINILYIVPPIIIMLSKSPLVDQYDLSSIKRIFCGAAPLDQRVEDLVKKRLKIKEILQGYGLTEATQAVLHFPFPCLVDKPGAVGILLPEMSAIIRDSESGKSLGPNSVGELCFKGLMVMKGYKDDPKSTRESFTDDGWLLTGDVAYYDSDGYFYIVDRKKELIKYKSFQVAPAELEALLITHPSIKDAAVIGVPNEDAGELPLAFVVKQEESLTEKEVQKFIEGKVSNAKRLRGGVRFVEAIPKNPSGKILRKELRAQVAKQKSCF